MTTYNVTITTTVTLPLQDERPTFRVDPDNGPRGCSAVALRAIRVNQTRTRTEALITQVSARTGRQVGGGWYNEPDAFALVVEADRPALAAAIAEAREVIR